MQGLDLHLRRKRYGLTQEELGELIAVLSITNTDEQAKPIKRKTINLWEHTNTVGNIAFMLAQVMDDIDQIYSTALDLAISNAKDNANEQGWIQLQPQYVDTTLPHGMLTMILADAAYELRAEGYVVEFADKTRDELQAYEADTNQ